MKSPVQILFIIFNLLFINLASANNMYDEELTESHLVLLIAGDPLDETLDQSITASCIDESSCDHFCHISSHMLGYINDSSVSAESFTPVPFIIEHESLNTLSLDPPSEPPRNLI